MERWASPITPTPAPNQLSGGERSGASGGRALMQEPDILWPMYNTPRHRSRPKTSEQIMGRCCATCRMNCKLPVLINITT